MRAKARHLRKHIKSIKTISPEPSEKVSKNVSPSRGRRRASIRGSVGEVSGQIPGHPPFSKKYQKHVSNKYRKSVKKVSGDIRGHPGDTFWILRKRPRTRGIRFLGGDTFWTQIRPRGEAAGPNLGPKSVKKNVSPGSGVFSGVSKCPRGVPGCPRTFF